MARTGYGQYAHLERSLAPPTDLELIWYKYDTEEFLYYDYDEARWVSKEQQINDRFAALELLIRQSQGGSNAALVQTVNDLNQQVQNLTALVNDLSAQEKQIIYKDNNDTYYVSYVKNGNFYIDECNIEDYSNVSKIIVPYPFS